MKPENKIRVSLWMALFFVIPLILGGVLYSGVSNRRFKRWFGKSGLSEKVLLASFGIFLMALVYRFFGSGLYFWSEGFVAKISSYGQGHSILVKVLATICRYYFYSVFLTPIFGLFVIPLFRTEEKKDRLAEGLLPEQVVLRPKDFQKADVSSNDVFVGLDRLNGEPVTLEEGALLKHCQVIGSTGFGKSASVLLPMLESHIKNGRGMILIDGKGEMDLLDQVCFLLKKYGREDDLRLFSLTFKDRSDHYNPLKHGNPTAIKDKLIGSNIWSEEFYKKKGEQVLLLLLKVLEDQGQVPTLGKLQKLLENPMSLKFGTFRSSEVEEAFAEFKANHKNDKKTYAGLAADLYLLTASEYGDLFEGAEGFDLYDAYDRNKIIVFHLSVMSSEETARRLGRMILQDIKTLTAHQQTTRTQSERGFLPVIIDEFASFAAPPFIEFLNKARSAGIAITIIHQSLGDLSEVGKGFARQIAENTNIKVILRIDDPETIEMFAKTCGTIKKTELTYQTTRGFFWRWRTGDGSMKEVDEYKVNPNEFRNLDVGEGIFLSKKPSKLSRIKFNYIQTDAADGLFRKMVLPKNRSDKLLPRPEPLKPKVSNVLEELF